MPSSANPFTAPSRKPVLIVLHGEHSSPGRIGRLLRELGAPLDIRRPRFGDPLPETMADHSGAVFFGGPMSANDEEDWLKREIDWIGAPLKEQKPFLGICLGAQLLARHLGHRVESHPEGRVEVGYYPIRPTQRGHSLCDCAFPTRVYQWHREGFDCPNGAVLLAEGEDFEAQAIQVGDKAFGFQFHPDVTYAMICKWTVTALERMEQPGAQKRERHIDGWFQYDGAVARWTSAFLSRWLGPADCAGRAFAAAE
ncbi:glutamine amidotransferase [Rhodoblastus acidophilus]|uniref:Glutamine amidotransferase n=1 Tax=Candidatus Rhodoblastus alkanivorans TaxID=2954117 RepID=A0ABS9Z2M9_9HYPH|nr:glutamine amidotransferase [Candidatus Rhodoblastus alkanivorans]MCI4677539.1 glutamine amidotransferase [Candidatus Rhodoblastus alkanivorans]MCI4681898.1 glutamine amidotransferase [Candidatus Rhodoblastus alkanivorans]MDI4642948.1 glutamine amidotransferase [Rhodoblastus acidophilus]